MRRLRQVRQPVLVLFLILELFADPESAVGELSPGPADEAGWTSAMSSVEREWLEGEPEKLVGHLVGGYHGCEVGW